MVIARIPTGTTSATVALGNHTHSYAGSSSAGGAATSANKLNTNAGSNTKPVYFSGGVPVECNDMATQAELNTVKDDLTVVINGKLDAVSAIVATDITWDKLLA